MADILYTIEYETDEVPQTPRPEVRSIGEPDRIGFVTTRATLEYLKGRQVALRRNGPNDSDPFDPFEKGNKDRMNNIYIVPVSIGPVDDKNVKWFPVRKFGRGKRAFHLSCGTVDKDGNNFVEWTGPGVQSLPVPE